MASLTSRLAGWAAGRLKGEKAREKTMEFVDKTGVGKLLSLAGDAALLGGAGKLAGMGARAIGAKLGMGAAGAEAALKPMPKMVDNRMTDRFDIGPNPMAQPITGVPETGAAMRAIPQPRMTDTFRLGGSAMRQPVMRVPESALAQGFPGAEAASSMSGRLAGFGRGVMGAAGRAGRALMERPEIVGQALTAGAAARTGAANRELERERMAQQESQFQRTYGQSEEERKREIDRQRRIAELLAPVFQRVAGGQG